MVKDPSLGAAMNAVLALLPTMRPGSDEPGLADALMDQALALPPTELASPVDLETAEALRAPLPMIVTL